MSNRQNARSQGFLSGSTACDASRQGPACGGAAPRLAPGHRAGFVTVLVLILLFLMLLMVVTYLRVMRSYAMVHQQVTPSAIPILNQLKLDLSVVIGTDGKIGPTARQPLNADGTGGQQDITIHEPYDYPWTASTQFRNTCELRYPYYRRVTNGAGDPFMDDAWLSPSEPDASGSWTQVSNPYGSFLVYSDAALSGVPRNAQTGEFVPMDAPAAAAITNMAGGQFVKFQNLSTGDPRLVDTDLDGIGDSLWFYPKNNVVGGLRYVAAARVIDLSACLNLNTALGDLATAQGSTTGTPVKGEGPYEIRASSLDPSLALNTNANSRNFRSSAGPWTSWNVWRTSGAQTNNDASSALSNRYSEATDEFQIRDFTNNLVTTKALSAVPTLFNTPTSTGHYGAVSNNTLRNRITTLSGVYDRAAPPPFVGSGGYSWINTAGNPGSVPCNWYTGWTHRAGDLNLCQMDSAGNKNGQWWNSAIDGDYFYAYHDNFPGLEELLLGVDAGPNPGLSPPAVQNWKDDYPFPEGFTKLMGNVARPREYQIQMAACIQDALERDNMPTQAWNWMGWKPLPALTEFYGEMPYVVGAWGSGWVTLPRASGGAATATPGAAVTVFPNTTLAQVKSIRVKENVGGEYFDALPYFWNASAGSITFQVQQYDNTYTRARMVTLTQAGANVVAQESRYTYIVGDARGQDFNQALGTNITKNGGGTDTLKDGGNWGNTYIQAALDQGGGTSAVIYCNTQLGRASYNANSSDTANTRYGCGAGIGSYAFEVANPYSTPIRLANVRFRFVSADGAVNFDGQSPSVSNNLDTYVQAADAAPATLMWPAGSARPAKDAEGYWVLKPGEKIIFFRNGTENTRPLSASTDGTYYGPGTARPNVREWQRWSGGPALTAGTNNVDLMKTLFSSGALPAKTYAVNLGTDAAAPEWNGHYNNRQLEHIELQVTTKYNGGGIAAGNGWTTYNRLSYITQPSGYNNYEFLCEGGIPSSGGTCPLPGHLVYRQTSARTFGVDQKLNLLQARPPAMNATYKDNPSDWGDEEFRTNTYANAVCGATNATPAMRKCPDHGSLPNGWSPGYQNTASTQPVSATYGQYQTLHLLGQDVKVSFPGPNSTNPIYSVNGTPRPRQDIKAGELFFNYVGIPSDAANYPGTFPELLSAAPGPWSSGVTLARDALAGNPVNGKERRDGTPNVMNLCKIMMAGPIHASNTAYRGGAAGTFNANPAVGQLVSYQYQNTIGDAINFYLAQDTQRAYTSPDPTASPAPPPANDPRGLSCLLLRTDVPYFNGGLVAHPLVYSSPAKNFRAFYNDIDAAQAGLDAYNLANPVPPSGPDPNAATRAGYYQALGTLRAGLRGRMHWRVSWADVICNYFQVDSPKYKGATGSNGQEFKPGTINLNTASKEVLKCLSLPAGTNASAFADGIITARKRPRDFTWPTGGGVTDPQIPSNDGSLPAIPRGGIALIGELRNQRVVDFGLPDAKTRDNILAWLPQQASCRSDVFCAYIVVQGYKANDFNLGPMDVARSIVIYSRDTSGNPAAVVKDYFIPSR